jgi:DNA-binding transcriptional ArsR family regulator
MDAVFRALADAQRRSLLDSLYERDGQSLAELCEGAPCSRQAISKHLGILESAGLLVVQRDGRRKLHFLNPLPVQEIGDRWIKKYARSRVAAVVALKQALEED